MSEKFTFAYAILGEQRFFYWKRKIAKYTCFTICLCRLKLTSQKMRIQTRWSCYCKLSPTYSKSWKTWNVCAMTSHSINQIKSILFKLGNMRSGCPISQARGPCIKQHSRSNWNLEVLVFEEYLKKYPEKNLSEQRRELTTNSTHIWRRVRESNLAHIGGRRVLSPLHQPCSPTHTRWNHTNHKLHVLSFPAIKSRPFISQLIQL